MLESFRYWKRGSDVDKATIGVVGSGLMGVGIATQSALHGYRTIVHDVDPARLASVAPKAEAVLDELIDCGRIDLAAKTAALARIETHAQLDVMASAKFVIEAIPEVLALKHRLYAALTELQRFSARSTGCAAARERALCDRAFLESAAHDSAG
jgi:3-hydroxyacyl-CoA dehydrogenase